MIHIKFPVRGHSYMPADRKFGLIEREVRKYESILTEDKYFELMKLSGTVKNIDKNSQIFLDWKSVTHKVFNNIKANIKITKIKEVEVSKKEIGFASNYKDLKTYFNYENLLNEISNIKIEKTKAYDKDGSSKIVAIEKLFNLIGKDKDTDVLKYINKLKVKNI